MLLRRKRKRESNEKRIQRKNKKYELKLVKVRSTQRPTSPARRLRCRVFVKTITPAEHLRKREMRKRDHEKVPSPIITKKIDAPKLNLEARKKGQKEEKL